MWKCARNVKSWWLRSLQPRCHQEMRSIFYAWGVHATTSCSKSNYTLYKSNHRLILCLCKLSTAARRKRINKDFKRTHRKVKNPWVGSLIRWSIPFWKRSHQWKGKICWAGARGLVRNRTGCKRRSSRGSILRERKKKSKYAFHHAWSLWNFPGWVGGFPLVDAASWHVLDVSQQLCVRLLGVLLWLRFKSWWHSQDLRLYTPLCLTPYNTPPVLKPVCYPPC